MTILIKNANFYTFLIRITSNKYFKDLLVDKKFTHFLMY